MLLAAARNRVTPRRLPLPPEAKHTTSLQPAPALPGRPEEDTKTRPQGAVHEDAHGARGTTGRGSRRLMGRVPDLQEGKLWMLHSVHVGTRLPRTRENAKTVNVLVGALYLDKNEEKKYSELYS